MYGCCAEALIIFVVLTDSLNPRQNFMQTSLNLISSDMKYARMLLEFLNQAKTDTG